MPKPIDGFRKNAAKRMRGNATNAEAQLWKHLRRHPMSGSHFRRQVVVGPYIADFACMAARVIIEVDGSQHGELSNMLRDDVRTKWFEAEGYRVLRFWNSDVFANLEGVLDTIHAALNGVADSDVLQLKHERRQKLGSPHPGARARRPSPSRGG
jgi:very-short-patch-repair endonuclease